MAPPGDGPRPCGIAGGAGLIGSALTTELAGDNEIRIVDDLSNGIPDSLPESAELVEGDITDEAVVADVVTEDSDAVFHLAADKYVNTDRPPLRSRAVNR